MFEENRLTGSRRALPFSRKALAVTLAATACGGALAQTAATPASAPGATPGQVVQASAMSNIAGAPAVSQTPVPYAVMASSLTSDQVAQLRQALRAARAGDVIQAQAMQASISDPSARKLVEWAMIDSAGGELDYATLARAQGDLAGWPRPLRLRASIEKSLERAALPPQQVIALFQGRDPETAPGAMALASADQLSGRTADAQAVIRHIWRNRAFDLADQDAMLSRFSADLTLQDHAARLEMLLYGGDGPAARAMIALVTPDQQALARARIAFHDERSDAPMLFGEVPAALQTDPGLAFDRAHYFRKHNLELIASGLVRYFEPSTPEAPDVSEEIWAERRALMFSALQSADYNGAYAAADAPGLQPGADYNEAQFFAGWVALTRLKNPDLAERHFARLQAAGETPITLSRALYWRGRAEEARGDLLQARLDWADGAKYYTAFYGQLSAARIGQQTLSLGVDPVPTAADRQAFESQGVIRAARMLGDAGERELFTTFVMAAEEDAQTPTQLALLVDMVRLYGDQALAMRAVRAGAQRAVYLPDRGYPVVTAPQGYGLPEPAFIFAITRQESGFDPTARSSAGARGMMQLLPSTAALVARQAGVEYSPARLGEADYNMKLGATYLGGLMDDFGGSYVLATAAYNAGPGRPRSWVTTCGDPRQGGDPADFIECIPISETRNYVMRVMENMAVYRARLRGGTAPLTLAADLRRGGWTPTAAPHGYAPATAQLTIPARAPSPVAGQAASPAYATTLVR